MSDSESEEEIEVASAWPIVIVSLIIGAALGATGMFFYPKTETKIPKNIPLTLEATSTEAAPNINFEKIEEKFDSIQMEELNKLKSYTSSLEKDNKALSSKLVSSKKASRSQLIFKKNSSDSSIDKYIQKLITRANDVVWISSAPLNINTLEALRILKNSGGSSSIICGINTNNASLSPAIRSRIPTFQVNSWIGDNTQILILDSKKIINFSNEAILLETKENLIIDNTLNWYKTLSNSGIKQK